jgi:hypothetical protein
VNAEPATVRRLGIGFAVAVALLTSACAAGQHAQTADEKATLDGTNVSVGGMDLRGLAIETPTGPSYAVGSDPQVKLVLINSGRATDTLTSITSSAVSGWGAYASAAEADAVTGAGTSTAGQTLPQPVGPVKVTPGTRVSWGVPDGTGVLLLRGTKSRIYPGTTVKLTFTFTDAGSLTVDVPVQLPTTPVPPSYVPSASDDGGGSDN